MSPSARHYPGYQSVDEAMREYRRMAEDAQLFRWLLSLSGGYVVKDSPDLCVINFPALFAANTDGPWVEAVREAIKKARDENPEGSP